MSLAELRSSTSGPARPEPSCHWSAAGTLRTVCARLSCPASAPSIAERETPAAASSSSSNGRESMRTGWSARVPEMRAADATLAVA